MILSHLTKEEGNNLTEEKLFEYGIDLSMDLEDYESQKFGILHDLKLFKKNLNELKEFYCLNLLEDYLDIDAYQLIRFSILKNWIKVLNRQTIEARLDNRFEDIKIIEEKFIKNKTEEYYNS